MEHLTPEGLKVVNDLAQRYGFSQEAVIHMMFAMLHGRGGMAQFNHPEFAGSGQWMRGGMLMLGDMFNHALKARVDGLCQAIAAELASQPEVFPSGSFQAQSQSGGGQQMLVGGGGQQMQVAGIGQQVPVGASGRGLFTPDPRDSWWPQDLGTPSASGSQNDLRYAFFPAAGRLAVQANGQVTVYDTGGLQIAGFSQQPTPGGHVVFTTPGGSVSLANLSAVGGVSQQAQSGGGGSQQQQQRTTGMAPMTFIPMAPMASMAPLAPMAAVEAWWPRDLGTPASVGGQNDLRYAIFPEIRRLAVESHGLLTVHDMGDLQISGCSQTSGDGGVSFTTATGVVPLASLPVMARHEPGVAEADPAVAAPSEVERSPEVERPAVSATHGSSQVDVLDALSKLAELKDKGILTEAEFAAKKTELLSRL